MQYALKTSIQSLWHEKWINLLSVLTIAAGLLVTAIILTTIYNLSLFTKKLPEKFSVMAYLDDSLTEEEARGVIASVSSRNAVARVRFISKTEALKELKTTMKDSEYVLEGLNENPLPSSLEIGLKKESAGPEAVRQLVSEIRKIKGISDVQYGEKFLMSIHNLKTGIEGLGLVMMGILTAGMTFICYSTVKILLYRKREEIETLKLLGATRSFIRLPFVFEGGAIGLSGGILGIGVLLAFYYSVFYRLSESVPVAKAIVLHPAVLFAMPAAGLLIGIAGALIAIGRIRY